MRQEKRSLIPTEELERVRFYVSTTSDRIHAQRLRMLKDLAAEVLEHRRKSTEPLDLERACNTLIQHLLQKNLEHPEKSCTGFTIHALALGPGENPAKLLYSVQVKLADPQE